MQGSKATHLYTTVEQDNPEVARRPLDGAA